MKNEMKKRTHRSRTTLWRTFYGEQMSANIKKRTKVSYLQSYESYDMIHMMRFGGKLA